MNYTAVVLIGAGALAIVAAARGSYANVYNALTNQKTAIPVKAATGGFASGNFAPSGAKSGEAPAGGFQAMAAKDAVDIGINPTYFVKQIQQESGFNPNARSSAGAIGIAQFMPSTAAGLGIDPTNPAQSLIAAAGLMGKYIRTYGGEPQALAAYNAGPGALERALGLGGTNWEQYLPAETQHYIQVITQ